MERYVSKELASCSEVESKDPMYDTIDDTTVSMQGHQTSSFNKGSQPPLPIPTDSSYSRRNGPPQLISGIDNKVYFENFNATQSNGAVVPYEEPISALKSFHQSAGKEKNTSSKTETSHETLSQHERQQPKCTGSVVRKHSIPASISADYAILEGPEEPETASIKAVSNRTTSPENTGQEPVCTGSDATTADYAVLEGPSLSDAQPYECPNHAPNNSKHTAYGANVQKSSVSLNTQNISMESPNTGPDYATLEPPSMHNM